MDWIGIMSVSVALVTAQIPGLWKNLTILHLSAIVALVTFGIATIILGYFAMPVMAQLIGLKSTSIMIMPPAVSIVIVKHCRLSPITIQPVAAVIRLRIGRRLTSTIQAMSFTLIVRLVTSNSCPSRIIPANVMCVT